MDQRLCVLSIVIEIALEASALDPDRLVLKASEMRVGVVQYEWDAAGSLVGGTPRGNS